MRDASSYPITTDFGYIPDYPLNNGYRVVGDVAYIMTSKGEFTINTADLPKVCGYNKWHITKRGDVSTQRRRAGRLYSIKLHRLLLGVKDPILEVDHKNHNKRDNTRDNLRVCRHSENGKNLSIQVRNKSGIPGVIWDNQTNNWNANIVVNYKRLNLGRYDDFLEAASARFSGEAIYYKEFAPNA
jgi:hypothetical protein